MINILKQTFKSNENDEEPKYETKAVSSKTEVATLKYLDDI